MNEKTKNQLSVAATIFLIIAWGCYFVFRPYTVSGNSMMPTYKNGQFVTTCGKVTLDEIERGDVIVFLHEGDKLIKRVIGLPGESLCFTKNGIFVNGNDVSDYEGLEHAWDNTRGEMVVVLKEDEFFVVGDNRNHSMDSRMFGPVKMENVVTKVRNGKLP